jgi:murein L,D-transpeptidase YcbB/YkuD
MIRRLVFAAGAFAVALGASGLSRAEEQPAAPRSATIPAPETGVVNSASESQTPPLAANTATPVSATPEAATAKPANEPQPPSAGALAPVTAMPAAAAAKPASEPQPQSATPPAPEAVAANPASEPKQPGANAIAQAPATPEAEAVRKALSALAAGKTDEERNERAALLAFYEGRAYAPLWLDPQGVPAPRASAVFAEIGRAGEWGLDARDFPLHSMDAIPAPPELVATADIEISQAVLKYGRYARGGRIMNPSEQLSSYLDRRPQLLKPETILAGISTADDAAAYLRGLNPAHPQFEKLRQKYLTLLARNKKNSAEAKRLLANMEEWRWMPADLNSVYIWNNLPDFTQRVVKDGKLVREVRIVAGETGKQTPIFTRNLKKITFRPTWIVPDSIKVRELWPSLLRGGGLMYQWQLELRSKDGKFVDWHRINWAKTNILIYDVIQPNGPKTVLGKVKFSFPSQHTVFMHDTRAEDKWMFNVARRTYSHGCMRVADPVGLARIALKEDKGWTAAQTDNALYNGPLNNEIAIEHKIPVHMTYFTALVGEDGELRTFPDVYGHERRITLALEGKWDRIVKGRDHLAPVELDLSAAGRRHYAEDEASEPRHPRRYPGHTGGGFSDYWFGE